jgi:primosomal protein N' (replication factor Y)
VATTDSVPFYETERRARSELGYPPFGRLANVVVSSADADACVETARAVADALTSAASPDVKVLGPSPAPLARLKRAHRWHVMVKAPVELDLGPLVCAAVDTVPRRTGVSIAVDIDAVDMM